MTLRGRRLMVAQETDAEARLNEALIKHLTGGDTVTGRGMYENFSSFAPTHKLVLCTNHRPEVRGTDHAVWRRLKSIAFAVRFEGDRIDRDLPAKLRAEAAGILAWMVRGCAEWLAGGLRGPASVRVATAEYAAERDAVGRFLGECCEAGPGYVTEASALYRAFREALPECDMSMTAFGRELAGLRLSGPPAGSGSIPAGGGSIGRLAAYLRKKTGG